MARATDARAGEQSIGHRPGKTWYDLAPAVLLGLASLALAALVVMSTLGWLF